MATGLANRRARRRCALSYRGMDLKPHLRSVPDFPEPGITFRDIGPLLADPAAFAGACAELTRLSAGFRPSHIVGVDSRGFLFAAPVALRLGLPLVIVRKKGRLPGAVRHVDYGMEYRSSSSLEIQVGMVPAGARVVVIDDVLATGGTARAVETLLPGCAVHHVFLLDLALPRAVNNFSFAAVGTL